MNTDFTIEKEISQDNLQDNSQDNKQINDDKSNLNTQKLTPNHYSFLINCVGGIYDILSDCENHIEVFTNGILKNITYQLITNYYKLNPKFFLTYEERQYLNSSLIDKTVDFTYDEYLNSINDILKNRYTIIKKYITPNSPYEEKVSEIIKYYTSENAIDKFDIITYDDNINVNIFNKLYLYEIDELLNKKETEYTSFEKEQIVAHHVINMIGEFHEKITYYMKNTIKYETKDVILKSKINFNNIQQHACQTSNINIFSWLECIDITLNYNKILPSVCLFSTDDDLYFINWIINKIKKMSITCINYAFINAVSSCNMRYVELLITNGALISTNINSAVISFAKTQCTDVERITNTIQWIKNKFYTGNISIIDRSLHDALLFGNLIFAHYLIQFKYNAFSVKYLNNLCSIDDTDISVKSLKFIIDNKIKLEDNHSLYELLIKACDLYKKKIIHYLFRVLYVENILPIDTRIHNTCINKCFNIISHYGDFETAKMFYETKRITRDYHR